MEKLKKGDKISVYVDINNPSDSVLFQGVEFSVYIVCGVCIIADVMGGLFMICVFHPSFGAPLVWKSRYGDENESEIEL